MNWEQEYRNKLVSFEQAASFIKSGDNIFLGPGPNTPVDLVNAIMARYQELTNVNMVSGLILYPFDYLKSEYIGHIKHNSFF